MIFLFLLLDSVPFDFFLSSYYQHFPDVFLKLIHVSHVFIFLPSVGFIHEDIFQLTNFFLKQLDFDKMIISLIFHVDMSLSFL